MVTKIWNKVMPHRELMENVGRFHWISGTPTTWISQRQAIYTHWKGQGRVNNSLIPLPPLMDARERVELVLKDLEEIEEDKACVARQTLLKEEKTDGETMTKSDRCE